MSEKKYLPILKFRQGEYQAVMRLETNIKESIFPLFVIPPVEYDFEKQEMKKSADEHASQIPSRLLSKWGNQKAAIDIDSSLHTQHMDSGELVYDFLFDTLLDNDTFLLPVIRPEYSSEYWDAAIEYSYNNSCGVVFRIQFEDLANPDVTDRILNEINDNEIDLGSVEIVIDYGNEADYDPLEDIREITSLLIKNIPNHSEFNSIYLAGTTLKLTSVSSRTSVNQSRDDWEFYKEFYNHESDDIPNIGFADFGIESPAFMPSVDMRKLKPAARVIYSNENGWNIVKGGAFRDDPSQMHALCKSFIEDSGQFIDESFSAGDKKIYDCAYERCSNGNMTTWKEAATSHHIAFVVHQLANFHDT